MEWEKIYNTLYEIQILLEECESKIKNPIITSISKRYIRYYDKEKGLDIRRLNNAVLENKIKNTKIQREILNKINELYLSANIQEIYNGLTYNEKECSSYVINLKTKYELVNKCLDLVLEIESLSETEYHIDEPFEKSEYAKMIAYQNQLYLSILDNFKLFNQPYIEASISNYCKSLSLDKKQKIYLESLSLSYDRNTFDYFNLLKISCIFQNELTNMDKNKAAAVYQYYQSFITDILIYRYITSKNISEVYQSLSEVHNSNLVKQIIKKK